MKDAAERESYICQHLPRDWKSCLGFRVKDGKTAGPEDPPQIPAAADCGQGAGTGTHQGLQGPCPPQGQIHVGWVVFLCFFLSDVPDVLVPFVIMEATIINRAEYMCVVSHFFSDVCRSTSSPLLATERPSIE